METIYKFKDWSSATLMKNKYNPCLKVDIGFILSPGDRKIIGVQLSIINEKIDELIYRVFVDYGNPEEFSLSSQEAVEFLNKIGFNCEYDIEHYDLTPEVRKILESLLDLGYSHVSKTVRPADIIAFNPETVKETKLSELTTYNYYDFCFLKDLDPTRIEGILENS